MAKTKTRPKAATTKAPTRGAGEPPKESPIARSAREAATEHEALLGSLLSEVREHVREIGARFYDIGVALKQIVDEKLYAVRHHRSFAALVKAEKLMSPRQATKLVTVARKVRREHALALGLEKTYALLGYSDATPAADSVAGLLEAGGSVEGRAVKSLSLRQIEAATRGVKADAGAKRPSTAKAKADARMAKAVAAGLREGGLPKGAITVGATRVRVDLPRAAVERWMANR